MEPENYPSNSHKSKMQNNRPAEKNVEKVISGTAHTRKKSASRKLSDIFIKDDIENVGSYVVSDILIPSLKKLIVDVVTDGVNMIFYGETGGPRQKSTASKVSYQRYYDDRNRQPMQYSNIHRTRTGYEYEDIVLSSRGEAESVLERMNELVDMYGMVTVADMYDLVGVTGQYTDNAYGWTNVRNADIVRIRDGYVIKLPKVMPID